jgi:heme oxygenase
MTNTGEFVGGIGQGSRPSTLAKLDGRTREARLMRETRAALTAHVGGSPSATQRALIERACQLTLRLAAMDQRFADTGAQTEHDSRTYLAWSNSLTRTLRDLGHKATASAHPTSIADLVA